MVIRIILVLDGLNSIFSSNWLIETILIGLRQ